MFADFHQFATELLVTAKLGDFLFRLAHRCWARQGLCNGFAAPLVGEAEGGSVTGIIRLRTMASWFAAAPNGTDDRTRPHVVEIGN